MSEYTRQLTAQELIEYIASSPLELSHEKIVLQRNELVKICQEWLECNGETRSQKLRRAGFTRRYKTWTKEYD